MALMMQNERILVFRQVGFQLPEPLLCWEIIENTNVFLCFLKQIQHDKG